MALSPSFMQFSSIKRFSSPLEYFRALIRKKKDVHSTLVKNNMPCEYVGKFDPVPEVAKANFGLTDRQLLRGNADLFALIIRCLLGRFSALRCSPLYPALSMVGTADIVRFEIWAGSLWKSPSLNSNLYSLRFRFFTLEPILYATTLIPSIF